MSKTAWKKALPIVAAALIACLVAGCGPRERSSAAGTRGESLLAFVGGSAGRESADASLTKAKALAVEAVSSATAKDEWVIKLEGVREGEIGSNYFASLLEKYGVEKTVEKKGAKFSYRGLPLKYLLAIIDGADATDPYTFDSALWAKGYDVTLVAKDGYSATFNTKDLAPEALLVATQENGQAVAPMTVGDSPKNLWTRDLASIETSLAPLPAASEAASFSLDLDINGVKASFTLADLEKSDLFLEDKGSYTTSAGTHYSGLYGGIKLRALIERYAKLSADDSVNFTAMDGYEMSYPGSLVLDEKDGTWLLAFRLDGDYLTKDPGFIRTIKVGPNDPNIDGHLSVRMVKKITVKQKDFKDFSVALEGKMWWNLDRSTIQSCVSCHKKTVTFEKKGQVDTYTGFPAWLALAYIDDPSYAPHKQDKSLAVYDAALAKKGYKVDFVAKDGFTVSVDAKDLDHNDDVIIAMYKNDANLPDNEFPLILVWDRNAKFVPAGIKNTTKTCG